MDQKLELEVNGERASNYLRLFLIFIFGAGTLAGIVVESHVSKIIENYIIGVCFYAFATILSALVLTKNLYRPNFKYISMGLELVGYSFVLFGFVRLEDPEMLTIAINDIVLYAIYFILIAESTLRFSPRFTFFTGISCTLLFSVLGVLIKAKGGDKASFAVTTLTIVLGAIFIFAMTIVSFYATKYVRDLVLKFKASEDYAKKESELVKLLLDSSKNTISDLDLISFSIQEISEILKNISYELTSFSQESIDKINVLNASIDSITEIAKEQENKCLESRDFMQEIDRLSQELNQSGESIMQAGIHSQTISQKTNNDLEKTIAEIQNISRASLDASKIVTLIDTIASQTNLLALNAAIEAARAGEEGRGFEIVASEVSKLADSSAKNARQISTLIQTMKLAVKNGETQIVSSGSSIKEINSILANIHKQVENFSSMIEKQSNLTSESREKTDHILAMSQKIKDFTVQENSNAKKIQTFMTKISASSRSISENVQSLQAGSQKLKEISFKLSEEMNREG